MFVSRLWKKTCGGVVASLRHNLCTDVSLFC